MELILIFRPVFRVEHQRPRIFGKSRRQSGTDPVHVLLQREELDQRATVADERRRDQVRNARRVSVTPTFRLR